MNSHRLMLYHNVNIFIQAILETCKKYAKEIFPDPPFKKRRKLSGYMIK